MTSHNLLWEYERADLTRRATNGHLREPGTPQDTDCQIQRQHDPESEDTSAFDGHAWASYRTYVKLVRHDPREAGPYRVTSPTDVYCAFAKLSECDRERFYSVHLDRQNQVCGVELVSIGTVDGALVAPREVYKAAILSNASGVILVHNHPSGCCSPSAEDKSITSVLRETGAVLDIPVYDHVIIGSGAYYSFAEAGLL